MTRHLLISAGLLLWGAASAASPGTADEPGLFQISGAPAGVRSLMIPRSARQEIRIKYAKALDASSFQATLNGDEVSVRFRPKPDSDEVVQLPLQEGTNVLRLSGDRVTTDRELKPETEQVMYELVVSDMAVTSGHVHIDPSDEARLNELRKRADERGLGLKERSELFLHEMKPLGAGQSN
jgi:hypothetical protein